jgi:serine-type D-Ala-D-Ala carboxypeptidase/endopeptidase (penicillin-binding protein 4)
MKRAHYKEDPGRSWGRWLLLAALLAHSLLPSTPVVASPASATRSPEELQARIASHIGQPRFDGATWGVHVQSIESGRCLFQYNAHKRLRPASNVKLFTAALALDRLGPGHRIRTSILATNPPDLSGTLEGDLVVRGRGDFSMSTRFQAEGVEAETDLALVPLVRAIQRAGVRRVRGGLVGDATWFHGPAQGTGWVWEDLRHPYGAGVSALILEENIVELFIQPGASPGHACRITTRPVTDYLTLINRTTTVAGDGVPWLELHRPLGGNVVHLKGQLPLGSSSRVEAVPVHHPTLWFVTRLKEVLHRHGIQIDGQPQAIDWLNPTNQKLSDQSLVELAAVESPPLHALLAPMMKRSQNLYAQALWLHVGAIAATESSPPTPNPTPRLTSSQTAALALKEFQLRARIPPAEALIEEGSGLSRRSLVTPHAIVRLLTHMHGHPHAHAFLASLPVAGVDGSLRLRMRGTVGEGNVTAKTGMLAHTFTLSGYVRTARGENLAFALLLNNHTAESPAAARSDLDAIAILLAGHQGALPATP